VRISAFLLVWVFAACGLLQSKPDAPSLERAIRAKTADQEQWSVLGEALRVYQSSGLEAAEDFLAKQGQLEVREEILVQDLRMQHWTEQALLRSYRNRYEASRDALSTLLLARLTEDPDARLRLLEEAKKRDPNLLQVRVEILANEPFRIGDETVLERLLGLLEHEPGLAEGWRLLREVGPRYGYPGLACTAAELEPWCPSEDPTAARMDQVRTYLAAGRARIALERLDLFGLESREAQLMRASALAEVGRAPEAWELLRGMQEASPSDPTVSFNLGLLARDYLSEPEWARTELERFLQLVKQARAQGQSVPELRVLQAKTWLREQVGIDQALVDKDAEA
jgi:tetratricopeptide (TPR) repeat protein